MAATVTVAGTTAPGVTPALADTSRSGSAMRMRAESRGHGRPAGASDTSDRTTEAFMKIMEEMRVALEAARAESAATRIALADSEGRYTELAAASAARDAALKSVIETQAATIGALTSRISGLEAAAGATKATIASLSAAASRPACEPNTGSGGKWAREWD